MAWGPKIIVVIGSMYSGKTGFLFRLARQLIRMKRHGTNIPFVWLRPSIDTRDGDQSMIVTRNREVLEGVEAIIFRASRPSDILRHPQVREAKLVFIDELQFAGARLYRTVIKLHEMGKRVILAGLDIDHMGRPFDTTARVALIPEAKVFKLRDGVCIRCGAVATHSLRLIDGIPAPADSPRFMVQGQEKVDYEPVCRRCQIGAYDKAGISFFF